MTDPQINSSETGATSFAGGNGILLILLAVAAIVLFFLLRQYFDLTYLSDIESNFKQYYADQPVVVFSLAFLVYFLVTGLELAIPVSIMPV